MNYSSQDLPTGMRSDGAEEVKCYDLVKFVTILLESFMAYGRILQFSYSLMNFHGLIPVYMSSDSIVIRFYCPNVLNEENLVELNMQREDTLRM